MESSILKKRKAEELTVDNNTPKTLEPFTHGELTQIVSEGASKHSPKTLEPFSHGELMQIVREGSSKHVDDVSDSCLGSLAISVLRNNQNPSRMQVPTLTSLTTGVYTGLVPAAEENGREHVVEGYGSNGGQPPT